MSVCDKIHCHAFYQVEFPTGQTKRHIWQTELETFI